MPLVLVRVDDRLIHGQVVEGWLRVIQANRIVVVSDEAAEDSFQICLMRLAVPSEVSVTVLKVQEAAKDLKEGAWAGERVLLLFPSLKEPCRLVEDGVVFESINVGGLHDAPGRTHITPSLALSEEDVECLRALLAKNVFLETRTLPKDEKRPVQELLKMYQESR
ncbi:MAG: PTS sugar transporter subunit IIB [Elusimicrobia bacterium]|nr:PTS sugar transporter subunit IIB [Elusimicrobiota bacterium]